jgi:1,4-dihydroxy-2-naphthoate polyprenyltransferase
MTTPPTRLQAWIMAARLPTLPAAVVPVIVAAGLSLPRTDFPWLTALVTLLASLLIQIGTNFANDYFDAKKGADTAERLGPTRVTAAGLIPPRTVLVATILVFALAALCGAYLITVGGWPILLIGVLSIAAGVLYTAGPYPLGYNGLGEVFTFIFFGLVAVIGSDYLFSGSWRLVAFWASLPVALLVTAIIVVNNLRDEPTDRKAGKRTTAVRFGQKFARNEFAILVLLAYLTAPLAWLWAGEAPYSAAAWLTMPLALTLIERVGKDSGRQLNRSLVGAGRLQLFFGLLFAVGLALG